MIRRSPAVISKLFCARSRSSP